MDNISGKANYSSDQDLSNERLKQKRKDSKKTESINVSDKNYKLQKKDVIKLSKELDKKINNLYKLKPEKELYDSIVAIQRLVEIFE